MMAKPAVEPRARCALMMPDAMPARSAGIDDMATFVVGASGQTAGRADEDEPERGRTASAPPTPAMMIDEAGDEQRTGRRASGARPPTRAAMPPAIGAKMIVGTVNASMQHAGPLGAVVADVLEVLRDDEQQPVDREQHGEQREDGRRVDAVGEDAHVHHRIGRVQLDDDEHHAEHRRRATSRPRMTRRQPAGVRSLDQGVGERADGRR